jgi:NADH-quinone oxidoreductase subunit C
MSDEAKVPPTPPVQPKPATPAAPEGHKPPAADLAAWEKEPVAPQWSDAAADPLVTALAARFGEGIESARVFAGDLVLKVKLAAYRELCAALKKEHGYTLFVDLCGAHFPKREPALQFEVVTILYSLAANRRVRVKVATDEATPVPSLVPVFAGANWQEREVYDMFGVRFADHPDMTRILLWEGFNGYPLRKDFPIEGIDTGAAIYPEYYGDQQGPVAGTGTGWKPKKPAPEGGGTTTS